jgi:hypothetical protein
MNNALTCKLVPILDGNRCGELPPVLSFAVVPKFLAATIDNGPSSAENTPILR